MISSKKVSAPPKMQKTKIIHGVEYVYEGKAVWNVEKKYGTHKRCYIGKMIDVQFVPSKNYQLQIQLEQTGQQKPGPVPATYSKHNFCGATNLFDAIGEKLGVNR